MYELTCFTYPLYLPTNKEGTPLARDLSSVRVDRLNALLRCIYNESPISPKEVMARMVITSERMLQRDIKYLREFYNAEIDYDFKTQKYICKSQGNFFLQMQLNKDEITVLAAGIEMAKQFLPHLENAGITVWQKIEEVLPNKLASEGKEIGRCVTVSLPVAKMDNELFSSLIEAAYNQKAIKILYKSPYNDKPAQCHILSPWKFYFQEHAWYMLAWNHRFQKEGVWRVSRIMKMEKTTDEYSVCPSDFNYEKITASAWFGYSQDLKYKVELRVRPPLAASIKEVVWHPTQRIEDLDDGSVVMTLSVSDIEPIERWVQKNAGFVTSIIKNIDNES